MCTHTDSVQMSSNETYVSFKDLCTKYGESAADELRRRRSTSRSSTATAARATRTGSSTRISPPVSKMSLDLFFATVVGLF